MFSIFASRVASRLFKKGHMPKDMPSQRVFRPLCEALRTKGYDVERAAELWDKCLKVDKEAMQEMHRNTGLYGIMIFGPLEEEIA